MTCPEALLLIALALAACGGPDDDSEPATPPTFTWLYDTVFFRACGAFDSCHGGPAPQEGLDMGTPEAAHLALVGVEAEGEDGFRVVPGDAAASILFQVVEGSLDNTRQMPIGAPLNAEIVEAIGLWIDDGAPNN